MWQNKRNTINDMFSMKTMSQSKILQYVIEQINDEKRQQLIFLRKNILFKSDKTLDSLLDRIEEVMRYININSINGLKTKGREYFFYQAEQQ